MDEEKKNETPDEVKPVHHDASEYAAPSVEEEKSPLNRAQNPPEGEAKQEVIAPSGKQPLDAHSKKGLIIASVSIGVVAILMTTFLVVGYNYANTLNNQTEMVDTGAIISGFYDTEGKRISGTGSFGLSYISTSTTPYFSLDQIKATPEKTTTVVLPYAARSEASNKQAYYVLSTADFTSGSNLFETNVNVSAVSSVYAERYYEKIGNYAFSNLPNLKLFAMGNTSVSGATCSFGDYAFANDVSLNKVATPNILTSIGDSSFLNCASLRSLSLPKTLAKIGTNAFKGATLLTSLTYAGTMAEFNQSITFGTSWHDATLTSVVCANGTLSLA